MDGFLLQRDPAPSGLAIVQLSERRYQVDLPDLDYRSLLSPGRQAEVAMVIQRAPGWVLLQTKLHYPPGIFRIPTGTVQPGESPEEAMRRELHEEANLVPGEVRHLFRLEYRIEKGRQDFATEAFLIVEPRGQLRSNDPSEAINAWREAAVSELCIQARELRMLEPPWRGWGLFRSAVHQIAASLFDAKRPETQGD